MSSLTIENEFIHSTTSHRDALRTVSLLRNLARLGPEGEGDRGVYGVLQSRSNITLCRVERRVSDRNPPKLREKRKEKMRDPESLGGFFVLKGDTRPEGRRVVTVEKEYRSFYGKTKRNGVGIGRTN